MRYFFTLAVAGFLFSFINAEPQKQGRSNAVVGLNQDTALTILTFGLMPPAKSKARHLLAKQYGFTYVAAAGCLITKPLLDSINKHNAKVEAELARRHGPGWKLKFEAEVDALHRSITTTATN